MWLFLIKTSPKIYSRGFDGEADLSVFSAGEIIFFRHISHMEFHATKKQILQRDNQVFLAPSQNQLTK